MFRKKRDTAPVKVHPGDVAADTAIRRNIDAYDKICGQYEQRHGEIFNPIEQERLHRELEDAVGSIRTTSRPLVALDYGCGTGNVTGHLLSLGLSVISADVSEGCLSVIEQRYADTGMSHGLRVNGEDLAGIEDNRFDFTATYSVLHHVPDYLSMVAELIRVTKPGGVIYIDHEPSEAYWAKTREYAEFRRLAGGRTWRRFLNPLNYAERMWSVVETRRNDEGDIHTLPEDHVEWEKIERLLDSHGCEVVLKREYLLYRSHYRVDVYQEFKDRCHDFCCLIARKK